MQFRDELLYLVSLGQDSPKKDFGKKKVQKLIYLLETLEDVDFGYEFEIDLYGPFSESLDDDLRELARSKCIEYVFRDDAHELRFCASFDAEAVVSQMNENRSSVRAIKRVYDEYAGLSNQQLESISTYCFILNMLNENNASSAEEKKQEEALDFVQHFSGKSFDLPSVKNLLSSVSTKLFQKDQNLTVACVNQCRI